MTVVLCNIVVRFLSSIRDNPVFLGKNVGNCVPQHFGDKDGMAAFIGSIGEYCAGKEEWSQYAERLDHFLAANSIEDAKKKDVFLAVIGPPTYKLLKSLVAPAKPGEKEYNQLVQVLTQHFEPAPSEIMRYRFNSRIRRRGESVATYISEL